MKNSLMVSLAFVLFGFQNLRAQSVQQIDTVNLPEILFETKVVDYGTIERGSEGTREFKFKNTGKWPLIITNVQGSCGCVIPMYPKEPIKPGGTGVIKVKYDTNRVGQFEKTLTVSCNSKTPSVVIKIKGKVLPSKEIDPSAFPFGK